MAHWISSKLKVAETLLQQIDQQAAESLRKGERKQFDDDNVAVSSPKSTGNLPPLRDQLKKKGTQDNLVTLYNHTEDSSHSRSRSSSSEIGGVVDVSRNQKGLGVKYVANKSDSNQKSTLKDSDWTELLNTPPRQRAVNGVLKDGGKRGIGVKGNGNVGGKVGKKVGKVNVQRSTVGLERGGSSRKDVEELKLEGNDDKSVVNCNSPSLVADSEVVFDEGKRTVGDGDEIGGGTLRVIKHNGDVAKDVSKTAPRSFSGSDSESDSDSCSSSDSGDEREREERRQRRREVLAAKAAAKAAEAIKEQENVVARLEGEKQSLEKIFEEQANRAAKEASELQSMMMEMMEATELEKQKHNHTRMEVLARMAKLETANADLAKSLATAQWNLETEVNRLAELRQQVDVREVVCQELRRKIDSAHQSRSSLISLMASKGFELQKELLEAECAFATDKIGRLQEKGMKLEENINMALKEMENPTEVEVELRRRLRHMTNHLIQKQAQVESLSSDKATLLFRIEAVSRLLDENKSLINDGDISGCSTEDLESATWKSTGSKLRPMLENKIQSGRHHLGSLVRQLDSIFSAGAVFLARKPAAKLWSLVYLVSLHVWVLYILFSHSKSTEDSTSSSVLSLENINGSNGV